MCDLCERVFYRLRNKIYLKSRVRHCVLCGKTSIVVTGPLPTTVTHSQDEWSIENRYAIMIENKNLQLNCQRFNTGHNSISLHSQLLHSDTLQHTADWTKLDFSSQASRSTAATFNINENCNSAVVFTITNETRLSFNWRQTNHLHTANNAPPCLTPANMQH